MKLRLAINGFGRIGRMLVRAYVANLDKFDRLDIIAINDIADASTLLHLLKFDSTHGRLNADAFIQDDTLIIQKQGKTLCQILLLNQKNPQALAWGELGVDVVLECTGHFRSYDDANLHRTAGARQVIIGSAPFDTVDASVVVGVNEQSLHRQLPIISGVSCTTQALVPLLHTLHQAFGLDSVMMTEVHAVTADQTVLDQAHRDLRRARASGQNIIPTTSSSINASVRVLPFLQGKLSGHSIRVPTINVACIDVNVVFTHTPTLDEVKHLLQYTSQTSLRGVMDYTDEPLVSSDFIGDTHSLIIDGGQLMQAGEQFKILAWYDNEVGYANRLLDMCHHLACSS
ncbi:MAG: type I glyceraldehyde-3-phosphate dehydrogenase [Moraxella sp.]|uniref:type I glyceraldehyde-3-phosphate dehydrogenase n=1 Tax=Moraxella sp. TaxID=479 RepID=UPI0026DBB2E7|nr:type I glyceraldehyde-3-phosphate dehydrogenase [Moraxella sp.]MDO4449893.1 type I glyceraldehyde-3-phosphate dehydrogenase [Moraxella sp.]